MASSLNAIMSQQGFIAGAETLDHNGAWMVSNLERYKRDLDSLISSGRLLLVTMQMECSPEAVGKALKKKYGDKASEVLKDIPSFADSYQTWYSEAKVLVKQILPDRLLDFVSYYERPKSRKSATCETYRIEDYLQGLTVTRNAGFGKEKIVGPDAAVPQFCQQLAIVRSLERRFESSLFDIRQLVRADLFDSDLDAAEDLAKGKFGRAAGAMAGVVLERHLVVCVMQNADYPGRRGRASLSPGCRRPSRSR